MATIHIPTPLRAYTGGSAAVEVDGATVGEALNALTGAHPALSKHLRGEDGKLRSFVNVYLGDEDIRFLDKEATAVSAGDELTIVPSIAGGGKEPKATGGSPAGVPPFELAGGGKEPKATGGSPAGVPPFELAGGVQ